MVCPARAAINVSKNEGVKVIRNRLGTEYVCRVVWGDSGDEPLPTRLENTCLLYLSPPRRSDILVDKPYVMYSIRRGGGILVNVIS